MSAGATEPSSRSVGLLLHGALGSCTRLDSNIGSSGLCGEVGPSVDLPFATSWRATVDLGFGGAPYLSAGDPSCGVSRSVGGFYVSPRLLLGYDVTSHLYVRGGGEALFSPSPDQWSAHAVVELGTSVPGTWWCGSTSDFELGLRPYVGRDGVQTTGASNTWIAGYGGTVVVRIGLRL
jgi:hypothetical protein